MTFELVARRGKLSVWVLEVLPPAKEIRGLGSHLDLSTLVADGDVDQLPFVPTFKLEQGTRWDDLLWTTERTKIASERLLNALAPFNGWRSFDVRIIGRKGVRVSGYHGFATVSGLPNPDVFNAVGFQHETFRVTDDVMEAIRAAGATELIAKRCLSARSQRAVACSRRSSWMAVTIDPMLGTTGI